MATKTATKTDVRQRTARGATETVRRTTRATRSSILSERSAKSPEGVRDLILGELETSRKEYESKALQDPFSDMYGGLADEFTVEQPPFNTQALAVLLDRSNMLKQCVDAYVANIEATGSSLHYIGPDGQEESEASVAEKDRLTSLIEQPNGDYDTLQLRKRNRLDYEVIGWYSIEVIRDRAGETVAYYNLPAHTIRLTKRDRTTTPVIEWVNRGGKYTSITRNKRFRRIVQEVGGTKVYFKEYGDPRVIDPSTGKEVNALDFAAQATEVLYVPQYRSGYAYGVPRYIHQLPSIMGSRESELTNMQFFKDNAIPAMAVLVSGGSVTQQTIEEIDEFFDEGRGREGMNKVLIIEATGDAEAADDKGRIPPPKIEFKPLHGERQNYARFGEGDKANQRKVRSAFRLNPIFTGESDDMTHATAASSVTMTDAQVFAPERNEVDTVWNLKLLADKDGKPPQFWRMRSNPPRVVNPQDITDALPELNKSGALTPNIAITITNDMFGLSIDPITEPWGDLPFAATQVALASRKVAGFEALQGERLEPIQEPNAAPGTTVTPDLPEGDEPEPPVQATAKQDTAPGEQSDTVLDAENADGTDADGADRVRKRTGGRGPKVRQRTRL